MSPVQRSTVRLAELVALLSLGTDLGFGHPMEHVIRECLGADVRNSLKQSFERWDGKGPFGAKGEELAATSRLINLADVVEVYRRAGGVEAAVAVARARSGTQFDPALVDVFCREAPALLDDLDSTQGWDAVIAAEPALERAVTDEAFEQAL